jgi:ankyrin repeat protein
VDIWEAAEKGNITVVKQYLDAGVDVNAKDDSGWTLLHSAAGYGHKKIAELLIAEGADVNAMGGLLEWTPLHQAAFGSHNEIVEVLIGKGADVNAKTKNGFTSLDISSESDTAGHLREHGAISGAEFSIHIASQLGDIEAVKRHIASGIDVNTKIDSDEWTALHKAALKGQFETAKLLIAEGAVVNAKAWISGYGSGATPLDIIFSNAAKNSAALSEKSERYSKTAALLRKHGGKTAEELKAEGN